MKFHILFFLLFGFAINGISQDDPLNIPRYDKIKVDGKSGDWKKGGITVPMDFNQFGEPAASGFSAELMLAWDNENIYLLAVVQDDQIVEKAGPLQGDGLEVFISAEPGTSKMVQYIIAPGITTAYPKPRVDKFDYNSRTPVSGVDEIKVASSRQPGGYIVEIAVPFEHTNVSPVGGSKWGLNVYLGDADTDQPKQVYTLFISQDTWSNHYALQPVILGKNSGAREYPIVVKAFLQDRDTVMLRAIANKESKGKVMEVDDGNSFQSEAKFTALGNRYVATLDVPVSALDNNATGLKLNVPGLVSRELFFRDMPRRYVHMKRPNRWEDVILQFEAQDKIDSPAPGGAVFVGSSSIARWRGSLEKDFPGYNVICRGFGGSTTGDALHFFDRIISPYQPKLVILAEGSNDLGRGDPPKKVVDLHERIIVKANAELPDAKVLVMSVKVSVTRKRLVETVHETNRLLKEMIGRHDNALFVDVTTEMLDDRGRPRADIFVADSTHMNEAGYEIWTRIMMPYMRKMSPETEPGLEESGRAKLKPIRTFILDADTGNEMDDLYAIARCLLDDDVQLLGLTSAHFNNEQLLTDSMWHIYPTEDINTVQISQDINEAMLHSLKITDLPHPIGCDRMVGYAWGYYEGAPIPKSPAVDFIADQARKHDTINKLNVLTLGALTNVASVVLLYPELAKNIRLYALTMKMTEDGAWNKNSFNARNDINGLDILLSNSDVEMCVIPGNVSRTLTFKRAETLERLKAWEHPLVDMLSRRWDEVSAGDSWIIWDLALVEAAVHPDWATYELLPVPPENGNRKIHVITDIDEDKMRAKFWEVLNKNLN